MKKTYIQPLTKVVQMGTVSLICGSQDIASPGKGLSYGGVDEYGEIDPD